jgi:hypothetical protein
MGEIRSTVELMMERTRGMTLSVEEQESLRKEKLGKIAKGYKMKLLQNPEGTDRILAALEQENPDDRELLEWLIWVQMVENLPTDVGILKHLDLMQILSPAKVKESAMTRLRAAFKIALKQHAPDRKKIILREKKKLAALGISGDAVVPKIPKNPEPDAEFMSVLEQCRKELLAPTAT